MSNRQILVFYNKQLLQRVTFCNEQTSATSKEQILQQVMNDFFCKRLKSDFLQRATSLTSNEQILQQMSSDFKTNNEKQVNFNE